MQTVVLNCRAMRFKSQRTEDEYSNTIVGVPISLGTHIKMLLRAPTPGAPISNLRCSPHITYGRASRRKLGQLATQFVSDRAGPGRQNCDCHSERHAKLNDAVAWQWARGRHLLFLCGKATGGFCVADTIVIPRGLLPSRSVRWFRSVRLPRRAPMFRRRMAGEPIRWTPNTARSVRPTPTPPRVHRCA